MRNVTHNDIIPKDWCDGKVMTVQEWGQREFESGVHSGFRNGCEFMSNLVLGKAQEAFSNGRDELASMLRELSKEMRQTPEKRGGV